MEVNRARWDQSIGSLYKTVDGNTVKIVAYSVRLPELTSRLANPVEDLHGALTSELIHGKFTAIEDHTKWKRLLFDPNGAHKGGDVMATPNLDLLSLLRGAER